MRVYSCSPYGSRVHSRSLSGPATLTLRPVFTCHTQKLAVSDKRRKLCNSKTEKYKLSSDQLRDILSMEAR